jgi:hypothetical protein
VTSCLKCKAGFYQNHAGQDSCFRCSSSSGSLVGSTECTCVGQNRIFQPEDGWCICKPGYEFVDSNLVVSSESDGPYDCQPIVYSRCATNEVRDSNGDCVTSSSYCDSMCGSSGGSFVLATGTCDCNDTPTLNEVCDEDCRNSALEVFCEDTNTVRVVDPTTGVQTTLDLSSLALEGAIDCSNPSSSVYSMGTVEGVFTATFGLGNTLSDEISQTRRRMDLVEFSSRYLSVINATNSSGTLDNPLVCLKLQDSLLFDISNTNYPEYVKDSLLNTNDNFDYTSFRTLVRNAASTLTVSSFGVTFTEAGTYVFRMSSQPNLLLIVSVMPVNVNCSTTSHFVEFTATNLITMGVTSTNDIVLSPDWNLVIGLLVGMLGLVLVLLGFMYYFRKRAWMSHYEIKNKSREQNKGGHDRGSSKGGYFTRLKPNLVHPEPSEPKVAEPEAEFDLESAAAAKEAAEINFDDEMLVPQLAKHMQSHHDEIDRQMHIQNDLLHELQGSLKKEVDELKTLLTSGMLNLPQSNPMDGFPNKLSNLLIYLKKDLLSRDTFESTLTLTHQRLGHSLSSLNQLFSSGSHDFSVQIMNEITDLTERSAAQNHQSLTKDLSPEGLIQSPLLRNCIEELENLKEYVESSLLLSVHDEDRRAKNSKQVFERGLHSNSLILPPPISQGLNQCHQIHSGTDLAVSDLVKIYKAFSQRIPKFVRVMITTESNIRRDLLHGMEIGNVGVVESVKSSGGEAISGYFQELFDAIVVMRSTVDEKQQNFESTSTEGHQSRQSLIAEIDTFLGSLESTIHTAEKDAKPTDTTPPQKPEVVKTRSLKRVVSSVRRTFSDVKQLLIEEKRGNEDSESDDDDEEDSEKVDLQNIMMKTLEYRNNLSAEQKNELMSEVDNDVKRLATILELEERRSLEALNNLQLKNTDPFLVGVGNTGMPSVDEGQPGLELEQKHSEEKQNLLDQLERDRVGKLNSLMRQESTIKVSDDLESMHESRVNCLLSTRYLCWVRYLGLKSRYDYLEVHERFVGERLRLRNDFYAKSDPRSSGGLDTLLFIPPELSHQLEKSCRAEELELQSLSEDHLSQRQIMESGELELRDQWNRNLLGIDIDEEIKRFTADILDKFDSLDSKHFSNLSDQVRFNAELEDKVQHSLFRDRTTTSDHVLIKQLSATLNRWSQQKEQEISDRLSSERSLIEAVRTQLEEILEYADSYGPTVDQRTLHEGLYLRILASQLVTHQNKLRILSIEQNLKSESNEMKLFCQLSKHQKLQEGVVSDDDITNVINDYRAVEKKKSQQLFSKLSAELDVSQKTIQSKQKTLRDSDPSQYSQSYEVELVTWCQSLTLENIEGLVSLEKSQLSIFEVILQSLQYKREYLIHQFQPKSSETNQTNLRRQESDSLSQHSQSLQSLHSLILTNLASQENGIVAHLERSQKAYPEFLTQEMQSQITCEIQREECELYSVYLSLSMNCLVTERLTFSMVIGVNLNTEAFYSALCTRTSSLRLLHDVKSVGSEFERKIHHRRLQNYLDKEFEERRILYLGTDVNELKGVYEDIERRLAVDLGQFSDQLQSDLNHLTTHHQHTLTDYLKLGNEYQGEIETLRNDYERHHRALSTEIAQKRSALKDSFLMRIGGSRYSLERSEDETNLLSNEEYLRQFLRLCQTHVSDLTTHSSGYSQQIYQLFQRFYGKFHQISSLEDDLNVIRNNKQQELEGRLIASEEKMREKGLHLLLNQIKRREEIERLRFQSERDLIGLDEQMKIKRGAMLSTFQAIVNFKRASRQALLAGDTQLKGSQIKKIVQREFEEYESRKLKEIEDYLTLEEKRLREEIYGGMEGETNQIVSRYQLLQADLSGGLNDQRENELKSLEVKLETEKRKRIEELLASGLSPIDAEKAIAEEAFVQENHKRDVLKSQDNFQQTIEKYLESELTDELQQRERMLDQKKAEMKRRLSDKRNSLLKQKSDEMQQKRVGRERQLQDTGIPEAEIKQMLSAEFDENNDWFQDEFHTIELQVIEEENAELDELQEKHSIAVNRLHEKYSDSICAVTEGLDSLQEKKATKLLESLQKKRYDELVSSGVTREDALLISRNEFDQLPASFKEILKREVSDVENFIKSTLDDLLNREKLAIRSKYEQSLNGLEVSKEIKKQNMKTLLEKKLEKRREMRKKELLRDGVSQKISEQILDEELRDERQRIGDISEKETEKEYEREKFKAKEKLQEMSDYVEKKTEELTRKENLEAKALRDNLLLNQIASLSSQQQETLAALTATRDGIKDIIHQTQSQLEQLRSDYATEMKMLKDKLGQDISRELAKRSSDDEEENKRKHDENVRQLEEEYQRKLKGSQAHLSEQLNEVIDEEAKRANVAKLTSAAEYHEAQTKVQSLKELHDQALQDLQNSLERDSAKQESNLKQRLEKKLKHKLNQLSQSNATEEEKQRVIQELETLEKMKVIDLRNAMEEEQRRILEEMEEKHAREMQQALVEARQKEMEAAVALAREAALEKERQLKLQIEQEANQNELKRIHQSLAVEEVKHEQNQLSQQKKEKGKLQDRLAEKKARKERQLRELEERALVELAKKQALEKEEQERLRQAKMIWSDRVLEASNEADDMKLEGRSKEDYCFRETLGKSLVPDTHLSEAAQMILGPRHGNEMSSMLKIHYAQRQTAIKDAVEKVMHEKAEARIDLVDKLVSRKSTDEFIKLSLSDLDTKFSKKQAEAEEGAILLLEREHTKQQMSLRQRQLEEISGAINLYSNIVNLNEKSPTELMMEYRLELEKEKERQEKEIMKEREERETQLRAEHEAALKKLKDELNRSKEEEESVLKLNQFEYHKKKAEETAKKSKEEQQKILDKYKQAEMAKQEALDRERLNQKSKMNARREEKRRKSVLERGDSLNSLSGLDSPRGGLDSPRGQAMDSPRGGRRTGIVIQKGDSSVLDHTIPENEEAKTVAPQAAPSQDLNPMLLKSINQIEEKLSRLDNLMKVLESNAHHPVPPAPATPQPIAVPIPYVDSMNPPEGNGLIQVSQEELSVQETAKLTFSQNLAQLLGLAQLEIRVARSLPPATDGYKSNAFKGSYFYDEGAQVLHIHLNRLTSSGDFGLVVIHALSHIKV